MVVRQDASTGQLSSDKPAGQLDEIGGQPVMHAKVYSPFQTYVDEPVYSLSAENSTGPFDILPHHHNFITLLAKSELMLNTPQGEKHIRISGGLMHVKANTVTIFLDV